MKLTTGMRCSTLFHSCTSRAPKKLVASRPVTKTMTRVKMAPSPGTWTPIQLSVCSATGSSSSDWSSVSKMNFSTQIVMISGIQISSPVMKYFLTAPETKRPGSRRAGWLVAVYSVGGASRLLRLGFRFGLGFGLGFGLCFGLGFGLGRLLLRGFLEVRGVPARAFQLEAGRTEQLLKRRFAAGRALGEGRLGGRFEKVLLVQPPVAAVARDRAKGGAAVNPRLLGRLEQPFVEQDAVVLAVLVHIETQTGALHDYLRMRRIEPMPAKVMTMEPTTCAPTSAAVHPSCWRPSSVAASPEKVENVVSPPRKPVVMSKRASGGSASKCDSTASAMPIR